MIQVIKNKVVDKTRVASAKPEEKLIVGSFTLVRLRVQLVRRHGL